MSENDVVSSIGSGCMTLSLTRAIAPMGHVYTFEYNSTRAEQSRQEFTKYRNQHATDIILKHPRRLGIGHLVTVTCQDVCSKKAGSASGFVGVPDSYVDAVFLDLPEPWLAIEDAFRVLKVGKKICCYSPCIEQASLYLPRACLL